MQSRIKNMAFFMIALSALAVTWPVQAQEESPASVPEEAGAVAPSGDSEGVALVPETPADSAADITATASTTDGELHGKVTAGVGLMLINNDSYKFGKFTGLSSDTPFFVGAADVQSRNGSRYWNLNMGDVGLDNRHFKLNGGKAGKYKFHFDYSELDSLLSNNSKTPFNGAGGATLTNAGFTPGATTSAITNLAASLRSVDLGTQRKDGDAGFDYQLTQQLGVSFNFRRYLKDGTKSLGAALGSGGSARGIVLPEPVDYQTDEIRTGLNWRGERGQANLEYYYSRFDNSNASLTWDSPFTGTSFPTTARSSLPPDNQTQRLSLSGSYKLAATTRVSARFEQGSMTQNEAFLPYTINPVSTPAAPLATSPSLIAALPLSSANARIDTTLFKVDLAAQPLPKLSVHAGIRHYATDNKTPINLYQRVINDTGNQVTASSAQAQYNRPFDYSQNQLSVDGSYYFGKGITLKLGLDHDHMDYDLRAVNTTKENTVSARLNKRWEAGATAFIDLAQSRKRSDGYDPLREFQEAHTSGYYGPLAANVSFDNLPAMRQLDIADRDRSRQGIGFTLLPHRNLTIGMNISRNDDSYDASQFGLQSRENTNGSVDATLTPDRITSVSLYYARQEFDSLQASRTFSGNPPATKALQATQSTRDWWVRTQDALDTIGANVKRGFLDEKLLLRLAYTFARTSTDYSFTAGSAVTPPTAMPTVLGRRQTMDLSGTYKVEKDMDVQLRLLVELYRSNDFATTGFPAGTTLIPNVLTLSGEPASYRTFVVQSSLHHRF